MGVTVRRFRETDAEAFAALNLRWIEEMFGVEESDRQQLLDPQSSIIDLGGVIAIAEIDGAAVGCGALVPPHYQPEDGKEWLELVKMATDPVAQGQGAGSKVMEFLIEEARARGCDAIWLETNDRLGAATRLYERKGFKRLEGDDLWPTPYARCNLQMVLEL